MSALQQLLSKRIPHWRNRWKTIQTQHAGKTISEVTVSQLFKGMRGVSAVICDTSLVDPHQGLLIRNVPVLDLIDKQPEEIFVLLCSGDLPDAYLLADLQKTLCEQSTVPGYVWQVLDALPANTPPMTMLSIAMLSMRRESVFQQRLDAGMARDDYWIATLEDAITIIARLPVIAAGIYRRYLRREPLIPSPPDASLVDSFTDMLGIAAEDESFREYLRRFMVVHSDHEGANASVLTSRIVHSTRSDLYYSLSAAMNCLAGPLHGLANQHSVTFALEIQSVFNGVPSHGAITAFITEQLKKGRVIPGFGHAVLRDHDPRYTVLRDFGNTVCPDAPLFRIAALLGEIVPPLLIQQGKAQNPYPNIDGISGTLLYRYGMHELSFYTVMFSVAQTLGICAQLILNSALHVPIFRPRSVTTDGLTKTLQK